MKAIRHANGLTTLPDHAWHWRNYAWRAYVQRLKHSDAPILCGPWRGEVGFEVLYWIPFLRQLAAETGIPLSRFVPISRGGSVAWYGFPTGMELFAMRTPQQVRVATIEQVHRIGFAKQTVATAFDRQVLRDAAETLKVKKYHTIHPAWMFIRMAPYWTGLKGQLWANQSLEFSQLPAPMLPTGVTLPQQFVAVRFYGRQTFKAHQKHVTAFIEAVLQTVQQDLDIVVLDSDLSIDDHQDLTRGYKGTRLHHLSDLVPLTPETNLAVMSSVLARAVGFVGTYGGFAQLALRMGVPSVSFYDELGGTCLAHMDLANTLSARSGVPAYVIRMRDLPMLKTVLPDAVLQQVKPSPLALQNA